MPKSTGRSPALLNRQHDADILALALPAFGALAADPLLSLVDTAFVGQLGQVPLAALGVNASVFAFAFFVFNFLAYGTTPLVGRAVGRGDTRAAGRIVVQALVLALGLGLLATALLELFAGTLLGFMGVRDAWAAPAMGYLRVRALAAPAVLLLTAANGAFRGFQDTRTPFVVITALNALNLALDPLLIFGFGWGLTGAAVATTVAQWGGALAFMILLAVRRNRYGLERYWPSWHALRPFLKIGWDLAVRTLALVATLTLATAVATRLGVAQVAAHQVAAQIWTFLALSVDALAVAAQALVARYRGAEKPETAFAVADRLLLIAGAVGLALGLLFWGLRGWLPGLFTPDPAVATRVGSLLPFVAAMQLVNALVFVWDGIFIGFEDFSYLAWAMVVSALLSTALLLLVVPLGWGLVGVWWAITALMVLRLATLVGRYAQRRSAAH